MGIHEDAEAARRKIYDDAFAEETRRADEAEVVADTRQAEISRLTAERNALTASLASQGVELSTARTKIAELEERIAELKANPVPAAEPSAGLPFFADPGELTTSERKWLDHYFPLFPPSIENGNPATDYYARNWLTRDGEGGIHASTGGRLRDRPLTNAPYAGDWRRAAAAEEIRSAQKYLRDGFFVNLMSTATSHSNFYNALRDGANANFPGFLVVPMIDTNGSIANVSNPTAMPTTTLVNTVASFLRTRNTWDLPDGSVVVGSYKANGRTGAWWADLAGKLKTATGKTVTFIHVYNNSPSVSDIQSRPAYASGAWSVGTDPAVIKASGSASTYKAAGRFLFGVQPQNIRPGTGYGPWFDEANNTEALRAGLAKAISDGADVVQGVTWNDLTEGGHFVPSVMRGTAALEISAAGIYEWKTGQKPEILRDHLIVSYRNQLLNASINPDQQILMNQNTSRGNRSPVREKVEILTYLTKPDTVTVTVGGIVTTYDAPAGEFQKLVDVRPGKVTVRTGRGESVDSPIQIRSVSGNQDRQYVMLSNIGPTDKQYDPTPT
jgi:hypothetical protein